MNFIEKLIKTILHPLKAKRLKYVMKELKSNIGEDVTDKLILLLLEGMSLIFLFDRNFRRNIINFNGRYVFMDKSKKIYAGALFKNQRMEVTDKTVSNPSIEIIFKDAKALRNFLFSGNPDIINALLENEINTKGNLNYIMKFGYLAKHIQLAFIK
ncbi:MAG: hypothetical protein KA015_05295 [Spirochaetes bacterium]|nr:hypothetical protein [Spirochaetota bacterium]